MDSHHYDVKAIAQWFILVSRGERPHGDLLTHYKLQKLVYYAEAWSMVLNGKQLFDNEIMAWMHGPFVPELFEELKHHGWQAIGDEELVDVALDDVLTMETLQVLERVWDTYGSFASRALEDMTQRETPWREARGKLSLEAACDRPISRQVMMEYYKELYNDTGQQEEQHLLAA